MVWTLILMHKKYKGHHAGTLSTSSAHGRVPYEPTSTHDVS
jgi:hypothetical protein